MSARILDAPRAAQSLPLGLHIGRTLALAAPIVVSRAALLVMTVMDTVMTGWAGPGELASLGLGVAPQLTFQMIAIGFLQATPILAAQAIGAGEQRRAGPVLRAGLVHGLALGLIFAALSLAGEMFFRFTGQPETVVADAAAVTFVYALGLPGLLPFLACNMFLEATGRPKTGMLVMLLVFAVDVPLNGIFALGWGGFVEPTGAVGAIATSSLMRGVAFIVLFVVLMRWEARVGDPRGVVKALRAWRGATADVGRRLRRIGLPMGLAQGVESAGFSALVFLGGMISAEALAAHQATLSIMSLIYMNAVGIGGATAIRVASAVGRGEAADLRAAGWTGIWLAGAVALPFGIVLLVAPGGVAGLFGLDGAVLQLTIATITVAGLVVTMDAMMGGALGALRGAGDVWVSFVIQAGAFWIVAVPLAAWLGLHEGLGAPGLVYGILAGVTASFLLLALRFAAISRRGVGRA